MKECVCGEREVKGKRESVGGEREGERREGE